MAYKAILSDFDGSLVSDSFHISEDLINRLKQFISDGNIFTVVTGRAYQGLLREFCHEANLSGIQIVRGGAEIIDSRTDEVIWGNYFTPETAFQIFTELKKLKIQFVAEQGEFVYTQDANPIPTVFGKKTRVL